MTNKENQNVTDDTELNKATLIWEEYRHRHELCWNLIFRITIVTSTLSIIPYLDDVIIKGTESIVLFTPVIGILVFLFGGYRLYRELKLFEKIKFLHREFQNKIYGDLYKEQFGKDLHKPKNRSDFTKHVALYLIMLFALALINFAVLLIFFYWKCH